MNVQNKLKKIQEDEKQRREDERQLQKELTYAAKVHSSPSEALRWIDNLG
jgi:hypothetical protein